MTYDPFGNRPPSPPPPPPAAAPPPPPQVPPGPPPPASPQLPPPGLLNTPAAWESPYQTPTLGYRGPGPEPKSQWYTDEDAYAGCMIYALLGLTVLAVIAGGVWWVISLFVGA